MIIKNNKVIILLSAVLTFLVLLFITSLVNTDRPHKKNTVESALLNPKYNLSRIQIQYQDSGFLELINTGSFWGAKTPMPEKNVEKYLDKDPVTDYYFIADQKTVTDFIKLSQSITQLNKIADSNSLKNNPEKSFANYGLDEKHAAVISYYDTENNCVSKIYFGALNQTLDQIFLRTDKQLAVYSMDSKIADFLDLRIDFWTDKNMIPEVILNHSNFNQLQNCTYGFSSLLLSRMPEMKNSGKKFYDKFPSLRFSKFADNYSFFNLYPDQDSFLLIRVSDGNGTHYTISINKTTTDDGDCYVYGLHITPSIVFSEQEKNFIKNLNCHYYMSEWTYNSIVKLLLEE